MADLFTDQEIKKMLRAFAGEPFHGAGGMGAGRSASLEKVELRQERELEVRGEGREGWAPKPRQAAGKSPGTSPAPKTSLSVRKACPSGDAGRRRLLLLCCASGDRTFYQPKEERPKEVLALPFSQGHARSFALRLPQSRTLSTTGA